jgi:hypothetical protein
VPHCVLVDDGDVEQGTLGHHALGDLTDEGDIVDHLRRDPPAHVADHDRIAQFEAEEVGRVDARIEAGDHEQAERGHDNGTLMAAGGGECAVAPEHRLDGRFGFASASRLRSAHRHGDAHTQVTGEIALPGWCGRLLLLLRRRRSPSR